MKRRDFLKYSGMMLGAAGVTGLPASVRATMNAEYETAILAEKPVYRPDGWKGARVRTLDFPGGSFDVNNPKQVDLNTCGNLGTTKIVGPIARRRELDGGFMKFDTNVYGDKAELNRKAGPSYYSPLGEQGGKLVPLAGRVYEFHEEQRPQSPYCPDGQHARVRHGSRHRIQVLAGLSRHVSRARGPRAECRADRLPPAETDRSGLPPRSAARPPQSLEHPESSG